MAKYSATTVKSLQDEIMRRANLALDNAIDHEVDLKNVMDKIEDALLST